jgi:glycosyltransferase involved in cell wall biosynthesis
MSKKIIVLTPVKNEEWILETFLRTTSLFADHIILADQNSADRTLEIANAFSKVTVIKNRHDEYDEASRQELLISTARKIFGTGNVLLALDADEIISHDSLQSQEWKMILNANPGTVLFFEKPTFFNGTGSTIRYKNGGGFPLGYSDDGTAHRPGFIHSTRIPFTETAQKLYLKEIKFLHCNLLSLSRQRAKARYYCMLEVIAKSKKWYHRVLYYNRNYNYADEGDGLMNSNASWTDGWTKLGITLNRHATEKFYWYDHECVKLFIKHGCRKFWMDDIWDINWDDAQAFFGEKFKISTPPKAVSILRQGRYYTVKTLFLLKRSSLNFIGFIGNLYCL